MPLKNIFQPQSIIIVIACHALFIGCASDKTLSGDEKRKIIVNHIKKAEQYCEKKRFDRAIKEHENILAMDSLYIPSYVYICDYYLRTEQYSLAERIMQQAVNRGINKSIVWHRLGQARFYMNKFNEAISALEKTLEEDSLKFHSRWLLAQLYYQIGNQDKAKSYLDTLIRYPSLPDYPEITYFYNRNFKPGIGRSAGSVIDSISCNSRVLRKEFAFLIVALFHPDSLFRLQELPRDLSPNDFYYPYCIRALQSGYLETLPDNRFYPDYVMTRRNLAHYLYTWLPKSIKQTRTGITGEWTDVVVHDLHYEAVMKVFSLSLLQPKRQNFFGLEDTISGQDAVSALNHFKKLTEDIH